MTRISLLQAKYLTLALRVLQTWIVPKDKDTAVPIIAPSIVKQFDGNTSTAQSTEIADHAKSKDNSAALTTASSTSPDSMRVRL